MRAFGGATNAYGLLALVFAVALLLAGLRLLPPDPSVYAFALAILPALYGSPPKPLMGTSRYVLVAFSLFIVLGSLLKNRRALAGWLLVSIVSSLVLCALFASWHYVS